MKLKEDLEIIKKKKRLSDIIRQTANDEIMVTSNES